MRVADMHCDTLSVLLKQEREGQEISLRENEGMVSLEKMRRGEYGLQTFAAFIYAPDTENALEEALMQIDLFERQMEANQDWIRPVRSYEEILQNWEAGYMCGLLSVEEGAPAKGIPRFCARCTGWGCG